VMGVFQGVGKAVKGLVSEVKGVVLRSCCGKGKKRPEIVVCYGSLDHEGVLPPLRDVVRVGGGVDGCAEEVLPSLANEAGFIGDSTVFSEQESARSLSNGGPSDLPDDRRRRCPARLYIYPTLPPDMEQTVSPRDTRWYPDAPQHEIGVAMSNGHPRVYFDRPNAGRGFNAGRHKRIDTAGTIENGEPLRYAGVQDQIEPVAKDTDQTITPAAKDTPGNDDQPVEKVDIAKLIADLDVLRNEIAMQSVRNSYQRRSTLHLSEDNAGESAPSSRSMSYTQRSDLPSGSSS